MNLNTTIAGLFRSNEIWIFVYRGQIVRFGKTGLVHSWQRTEIHQRTYEKLRVGFQFDTSSQSETGRSQKVFHALRTMLEASVYL